MREIKFRGYSKEKRNWYYGFVCKEYNEEEEDYYYIDYEFGSIRVKEDSIGQYTGFRDKNDVEIYEGDIVRFNIANHIVIWNKENASFGLMLDEIIIPFMKNKNCGIYEVVGNVYENKLKER